MNTIQSLANDIKILLDHFPQLVKFYIGKTSDYARRYEDHVAEGYNFLFPIAEGNAKVICEVEKALQEIFKDHPQNDNHRIGGGSQDADLLYLAINTPIKHIDDLHDDLTYNPRQL